MRLGYGETKISDAYGLRERFLNEWDKLDQRIIDKVVGEWARDFELVWLRKEGSLNRRRTFLIAH